MKSSNVKRQKKNQKTSSKLFDIFVGESVYILTRSLRGTQVDPDLGKINGNVIIQGILLDECDGYYYLSGDGGNSITDSIVKNDIIRMYTQAGELNVLVDLPTGAPQ